MANITEEDIANMALQHIGEGQEILDIQDTESDEAAKIRLWYEPSRIQALRHYDWTFARSRETLVLRPDEQTIEWAFRYNYPANCIAIRRLTNPWGYVPDDIPLTIETNPVDDSKSILTNLEDAEAVFTKDITDPQLFSMEFVMAFSLGLAANIAYPLTKKRSLVADLKNEYRFSLMDGSNVDATEEVEQDHRDSGWIRSRQ